MVINRLPTSLTIFRSFYRNLLNGLQKRYLFIGIVILSFVLRFYLLGVNPPSLDWDEASIGYNAYSILNTARDEYGNFLPLSFRSFDDYKPPVYIYLTVPTVALFGLNEFAVRFPAAIFGVLAVVVTYFLTNEFFLVWKQEKREKIALLASLFLAFSPWHLQFSRAAFEGNVGMFFLILALLLFFKALKRQSLYIFFSLSIVLSMYSYHSFRLIDPIILIFLIVLFYKKIIKQKVFILSLVLTAVLVLPIYLSFILPNGTGARLSMVTIFDDPNILKVSSEKVIEAKMKNDVVGEILNNRRFYFIPKIAEGYLDHLQFNFLFVTGDGGVQHHAYNMGMLYLWDAPFVLFGLYCLVKRVNKRVFILLALLLLGPVPASITSGTPQPIRAIAMIPAFQIIIAVGFYELIKLLSRHKKLGVILISSILILFTTNILYYLYSYYFLTPIKYGYFWQFGNKEAIQYAKSVESKYDKIIMTYEYDQPYIYYLFYNKIDPLWYQKNWNYAGTGDVYRFYRKIGKYEFRNIDFNKDKLSPSTLLIGTPKEIPKAQTLKEIKFPDGRIAYKIVAT